MSYYKVILDQARFDEFINFLPDLEANEAYYLCLFGRHKYAPSVKNLKDNQVSRFTSEKDKLAEKIRRLECPIGGYTRDGEIIPQEALALYVSLNPRSLVKANKILLLELANAAAAGKWTANPLSAANTALHKAIDRKVFVDFDFDNVEPSAHKEQIESILPGDSYRILKTRGGFHLIVRLDKVRPLQVNWYKALSALEGCDVKGGDTLVPFAGCSQGGFIPYLMPQP